jgi:hypothetical protein
MRLAEPYAVVGMAALVTRQRRVVTRPAERGRRDMRRNADIVVTVLALLRTEGASPA